MMKPWVDSYAKNATLPPSVTLSVIAHFILIGAAVAGTASAGTEQRLLADNSIVRFLAPPDRASGQLPQREMIRYVAIAIPATGTGVSLQALETIERLRNVPIGQDQRDAPAMPELHGEDSVFSVVDVDSAATRYEWSAAPAYPPLLLENRTEGFVRAEFIVAQDGYADSMSLRILETTHQDFTKAVRDALPFMRFKPAKLGRQTVSQLVLQEFRFRITTAAADTFKTRRAPP